MTTPQTEPTEPAGGPERRIRRGCLPIIFLLLLVTVFNFVEYGLNLVVMVAGVLLVVAIPAYAVLLRVPKS